MRRHRHDPVFVYILLQGREDQADVAICADRLGGSVYNIDAIERCDREPRLRPGPGLGPGLRPDTIADDVDVRVHTD
jgi:hypothetical protein